MTGLSMITIAIGFVFLYTLLSLVCTVVNEWIARWFDFRKTILRGELKALLPMSLLSKLEAHPLVRIKGDHAVDYLAPATFALALMDLIVEYKPGQPGFPGTVTVKVGLCSQSEQVARSLIANSSNLDTVQTRIEKWYALGMEEATGRYKRWTQVVVGLFALLLSVALNVDAGEVGRVLYRAQMQGAPQIFPILWEGGSRSIRDAHDFFFRLPGYFISACCISLGAPFWFDLLGKLVNLRQTGLPPQKDPKSDMVAH